jgi:hypothetical protein
MTPREPETSDFDRRLQFLEIQASRTPWALGG